MDKEEKSVWICCYCTLQNDIKRSSCEVCDAERANDELETLFAAQAAITWTCVRCKQENSGHRVSCIKCHATGSWESDDISRVSSTEHCRETDSLVMQPSYEDTRTKTLASGDFVHVDSLPVATSEYESSDEQRIVLLGRTGEGKSATGNTILDGKLFKSSLSSNSVTKTCERGTCSRHGRFIQVIDTPGMYDTEMSIPDITREVVRCVGMTAPGPHAFILVIRPDRFTEEVQNSVDHYVKTFGEGMLKYLIILFTRKDDLANDGKTIDEFIQNGSEKFQVLVASCNKRYIAFNNRGTFEEKDEDVKRLINIIDEMVQANKGVYTNGMFQEAEKLLRENEEKLRKEHEQLLNLHVIEIRQECQRQIDAKEAVDTEIIHQYQIRLQELESSRDDGRAKRDAQELRKTLNDIRAQHKREIRRIREIAGTKEERAKNEKVNYREKTRESINKGSSFVKDKLLPGLLKVATVALPILIAGGFELLKILLLKKV